MAVRTGAREAYADAMGVLWTGVSPTLAVLDGIAGEPSRLDGDRAERALRRLQYSLHVASEHAYGLAPPAGAETAHAELSAALACARDATAEVADAVETLGAEGAEPLVHEWRGALFRVRLARLRLASPATPATAEVPLPDGIAGPLLAFLLALLGALSFVAGATLHVWPLWSAGLLAVCGSVLAYRP